MANVSLIQMSLREIEHFLAFSWLPRAAAVVITSAPGFGKTTMGLNLSRRTQAAYFDFGATYMNVGGADSVEVMGMPILTDPDYPLSVNGMPLWLQPDAGRGLRGAFPALCPPELQDAPVATAAGKAMPAHLARIYRDGAPLKRESMCPYETGIINVDEVGATQDRTVQQPLSRLANDAAINSWGVDNRTWAKLLYTNAADQGAGAVDLLTHLGNRVRHVHLVPNPDDYLVYWAQDTLFTSSTRGKDGRRVWTPSPMRSEFRYFASWLPSVVFDENACKKGSRFCSPRSYEAVALDVAVYAQKAMKLDLAHEDIPCDRKEIAQLIACGVGDGVAQQFAGYMPHYSGRVRIEDVLNDPMKVPLPEEPVAMSILTDTLVDLLHPTDPGHMKAGKKLLCRLPKLNAGRWCYLYAERYGLATVLQSEEFTAVTVYADAAANYPLLSRGM